MFTASDARALNAFDWDDEIKRLVLDAKGEATAMIPIYWSDYGGSKMDEKIDEAVSELKKRGFKSWVHDRNSLRFAEVHFSWGDSE